MDIHTACEQAYKNGYNAAAKERDILLAYFKEHPVCTLCKNYNLELDYFTPSCEDCGWYPWANDELPYKWEWRGCNE